MYKTENAKIFSWDTFHFFISYSLSVTVRLYKNKNAIRRILCPFRFYHKILAVRNFIMLQFPLFSDLRYRKDVPQM